MNIMLLGSNGQLGKELDHHLSAVGNVYSFSRSKLDITREKAVNEVIQNIRPDIIINAAAYTKVDKAEKDKEKAFAINSVSVSNLAQLAKVNRVWLIHYSTDYVFDGTKSEPYNEKDFMNPINIYGASKLAGEKAITKSNCQHLIFRSSWVVGKDGHNFAKTILRLAINGEHLKIVRDQIGVPTTTSLISKVTVDAILAIQRQSAWPIGIYHLAPKGISDWFEIAQTLLTFAEHLKLPLKITADDVQAITSAQYQTLAKRPLNSLLNTKKLQSKLSFDIPYWKDDFLKMAKYILYKELILS